MCKRYTGYEGGLQFEPKIYESTDFILPWIMVVTMSNDFSLSQMFMKLGIFDLPKIMV